jgi:hypothetical protein
MVFSLDNVSRPIASPIANDEQSVGWPAPGLQALLECRHALSVRDLERR